MEWFKPMIKYHNELNKIALSGLTTREVDILFAICSVIRDQGTNEVTFSFNEIKRLASVTTANQDEFVSIIKNIYGKLSTLKVTYDNGNKFGYFVLFTKFLGDRENEIVSIQINSEFSYLLNDLTRNFTMFELQEFNGLESIYSKHLYRLLKQFKSTGEYRVKVDDFKKLLDIPESYTMKRITDKILNPIIEKEMPKYFKNFSIEKIREGRSIKYLVFRFNKEKQYTLSNEDSSISVSENNANQILIEQRKEDILCPKCGKPLVLLSKRNGDTFWGHPNYNAYEGSCKQSYSTKEDIEIDREKRLNLIENEADRAKFEKEVKELIDQHKDIVKLSGFEKRYVCIEQIEQQDLFYQNPVMRIKIDKNAINVIKSCIEEWS
jgi:plasmid replication initiation protein